MYSHYAGIVICNKNLTLSREDPILAFIRDVCAYTISTKILYGGPVCDLGKHFICVNTLNTRKHLSFGKE